MIIKQAVSDGQKSMNLHHVVFEENTIKVIYNTTGMYIQKDFNIARLKNADNKIRKIIANNGINP